MDGAQKKHQICADSDVSEGQEDQLTSKRRKCVVASEKKSPPIKYFDTIPDALLLEILKKVPYEQLDFTASVCRRFSSIIESRSFWNKVVRENCSLHLSDLGELIRRPVQNLTLRDVTIYSQPEELEPTQPSWDLKEVYLDEVITLPDNLVKLLKKCKQLRKVSLLNTMVNENVVVELSKNKNIEFLRLCVAKGIAPPGFVILLQNLRKLKEFECLTISQLYRDAGRYLLHNAIFENLAPSLLSLTVSECKLTFTDDHIALIVKNCPLLQSLTLTETWSLTAKSMKSLLNLKHLRILNMHMGWNIPAKAYSALTQMESLAEVDLTYCMSSEAVEEVFKVNIVKEDRLQRVGTIQTRFGLVKIKYSTPAMSRVMIVLQQASPSHNIRVPPVYTPHIRHRNNF